MTFLEIAKARYSVRAFKATPIEEEKLAKVIEAGMVAPTSRNSQPQRIYAVQSAEKLEALSQATSCIFGAPCVLVFAYDNDRVATLPFKPGYNFGEMDTTIVETHMMLQATELGLGTCWVGMFTDNIKDVLGITDNVTVCSVMPIGYPADNAEPHPFHSKSIEVSDVVTYL